MANDPGLGSDGSRAASEDTTSAREHVHEAQQNRDVLAASTAAAPGGAGSASPAATQGPTELKASAGSAGGEDASGAAARARQAADNRDALEAENRRIRASEPAELRDRE
jgi:hypothetical protein